jgi:hypothetical protein
MSSQLTFTNWTSQTASAQRVWKVRIDSGQSAQSTGTRAAKDRLAGFTESGEKDGRLTATGAHTWPAMANAETNGETEIARCVG